MAIHRIHRIPTLATVDMAMGITTGATMAMAMDMATATIIGHNTITPPITAHTTHGTMDMVRISFGIWADLLGFGIL